MQCETNQPKNPFVCGLCGFSSDEIRSYHNHFPVHCFSIEHLREPHVCISETETFKCHQCSAVFPAMCKLHRHLMKCVETCSYVFDNSIRTAFPINLREFQEYLRSEVPEVSQPEVKTEVDEIFSAGNESKASSSCGNLVKERNGPASDPHNHDQNDIASGMDEFCTENKKRSLKQHATRESNTVRKPVSERRKGSQGSVSGMKMAKKTVGIKQKLARSQGRKQNMKRKTTEVTCKDNENENPEGVVEQASGYLSNTSSSSLGEVSIDIDLADKEQLTKQQVTLNKNNSIYALRAKRKKKGCEECVLKKQQTRESVRGRVKQKREKTQIKVQNRNSKSLKGFDTKDSMTDSKTGENSNCTVTMVRKEDNVNLKVDGTEYNMSFEQQLNTSGTSDHLKNSLKECSVSISDEYRTVADKRLANDKWSGVDENVNIRQENLAFENSDKIDALRLQQKRKTVMEKKEVNSTHSEPNEVSITAVGKGVDRKRQLVECAICTVKLSPGRLQHHYRSHSSDRPYKCDQCSKTYKYKSHLVVHKMSHADVLPFYCDQCGHGYTTACGLRTHMLYHHSADRTFKCKHCDAAFYTQKDLNRHSNAHSGDKKLQCDLCGMTFLRKDNLEVHVKGVHQQERRHACTLCEKKFLTNYQLKCHLMKHTGIRPYQCHHCEQAFVERKELRRHMKKQHNLQLSNSHMPNLTTIMTGANSMQNMSACKNEDTIQQSLKDCEAIETDIQPDGIEVKCGEAGVDCTPKIVLNYQDSMDKLIPTNIGSVFVSSAGNQCVSFLVAQHEIPFPDDKMTTTSYVQPPDPISQNFQNQTEDQA